MQPAKRVRAHIQCLVRRLPPLLLRKGGGQHLLRPTASKIVVLDDDYDVCQRAARPARISRIVMTQEPVGRKDYKVAGLSSGVTSDIIFQERTACKWVVACLLVLLLVLFGVGQLHTHPPP